MSFFSTPSPNYQEVVDVTTSYYTGPDFILTRYPRPNEGKIYSSFRFKDRMRANAYF